MKIIREIKVNELIYEVGNTPQVHQVNAGGLITDPGCFLISTTYEPDVTEYCISMAINLLVDAESESVIRYAISGKYVVGDLEWTPKVIILSESINADSDPSPVFYSGVINKKPIICIDLKNIPQLTSTRLDVLDVQTSFEIPEDCKWSQFIQLSQLDSISDLKVSDSPIQLSIDNYVISVLNAAIGNKYVLRSEIEQLIKQGIEDYFNENPDTPVEPDEPTESIGTITEDNSIVIDETQLETGKYTLRYIDSNNSIIDNFNEITSFEINK